MKASDITAKLHGWLTVWMCSMPALVVSAQSLICEPGKAMDYEIVFPKQGFKGAPILPSASLSDFMPPRGEQDFIKKYVRVSMVEEQNYANGHRCILRLDELDSFRRPALHGIYFAYLNILPEGTRLVCKYENSGSEGEETGIRFGIPFPLTCTKPPSLGFAKTAREGHVSTSGRGVEYVLKRASQPSLPMVLEATCFEKRLPPKGQAARKILWYGAEIAEISKTNDTTKILFRETQEWGGETDWLWKKMERFDEQGHLLLRCVQLDQVAKTDKGSKDNRAP